MTLNRLQYTRRSALKKLAAVFVLTGIAISNRAWTQTNNRQPDRETVPDAGKVIEKAVENERPKDVLALLNGDDDRTAVVAALLLAANRDALDLLRKTLTDPECRRPEYLIAALAVTPDKQGIQILVDYLNAAPDEEYAGIATAALRGITGKDLDTPQQWKQWWQTDKDTYQIQPKPFEKRVEQVEKLFGNLLSERVRKLLAQARKDAMQRQEMTAEQLNRLMLEVEGIRERGNEMPRPPEADNASVLFGMSRFHEALTEYTAALERNPDNLLCLYMRAACLIQLQQYRKAQHALNSLTERGKEANLARWLARYAGTRAEKPDDDPLHVILSTITDIDVQRRPATAGWTDEVVPALFVQTERQIAVSPTVVARVGKVLREKHDNPEFVAGAAFLYPPEDAIRILEENRLSIQGIPAFQTVLLQAYLAQDADHLDQIVSLLTEMADLDPENGFFNALLAYYTAFDPKQKAQDPDTVKPLDETQAQQLLEALSRPRIQTYTSNGAAAAMRTLQEAQLPFAAALATQVTMRAVHHQMPLGMLGIQCVQASENALQNQNIKQALTLARVAVRLGQRLQNANDRAADIITGCHIEKNGRFQLMRVFTQTGDIDQAAEQRALAMDNVLRIQQLKDRTATLGALVMVPVPEIQQAWYGAAVNSEIDLITEISRAEK
jgi:tetratricopeptide (TPR) repeat protein